MMKKLFLGVLAVMAMASCQQSAGVSDIPVYAWEGYSDAATLTEHFAQYQELGLKGVCINVGFNVERADTAAKLPAAWCWRRGRRPGGPPYRRRR